MIEVPLEALESAKDLVAQECEPAADAAKQLYDMMLSARDLARADAKMAETVLDRAVTGQRQLDGFLRAENKREVADAYAAAFAACRQAIAAGLDEGKS